MSVLHRVHRKEVAEIYHDSFSGFSLPDERRHGPMRHMCNEPGSREGKAGDEEKERKRSEKQTSCVATIGLRRVWMDR